MPRIAAVIGAFAAIAGLIFVNIKSYPTVWEMVGASPWFTQGEESSPQKISSQPETVVEKDKRAAAPKGAAPPRPKLKSLADAESLDSDSLAGNAAKNNGPPSDPQSPPGLTQSPPGPAKAYRGLNLGPIKIVETVPAPLSAPGDSRWPAEMSPKMKYAAKPPILETYQNWNPERPLVPVKQPQKTKNPSSGKQDKNRGKPSKNASPDPKNPSCAKTVIRHLPPVDPKDRPIRLSIPAHGLNSPIPIYPGTGR